MNTIDGIHGGHGGFLRSHLALMLIMLISMSFWGGSWVSAKLISSSMPAYITAFWRFFLHSLAFALWMCIGGHSFKIHWKQFAQLFGGAILLSIYNLLFFYGLSIGFAGKSGVIVTTLNPLFAFIISSLVFRNAIQKGQIVGLLIGVVGGFLLMEPAKIFSGSGIDSGVMLFVLAAFLWAALTNLTRQIQKDLSLVPYSFYLYALTTLILGGFSALNGGLQLFGSGSSAYTPGYVLNILYLALPAGVFANTMYFYSVKRLGPQRGASFTFIVPVSALLLSFFLLGEIPHWTTVAGGALALLAVYTINMLNLRPKKS